jgi:hypothetical protein
MLTAAMYPCSSENTELLHGQNQLLTTITFSCGRDHPPYEMEITSWQHSKPLVMTAPFEFPRRIPNPLVLIRALGYDEGWGDEDETQTSEFLSLAMCEHYQMTILFSQWYAVPAKWHGSPGLQHMDAYASSGGAVLDDDLYRMLGSSNQEKDWTYAKDLFMAWQSGFFPQA